MYLIKVMERFRSQEACIQHLEQVRWGKGYPHCRPCGKTHVKKGTEVEIGGIGVGIAMIARQRSRWRVKQCSTSRGLLYSSGF